MKKNREIYPWEEDLAIASCVTQWLGGFGAYPPKYFLNFRHSEINSGAFWDAFLAWQGTHTNRGTNCNLHTPNDQSTFGKDEKGRADPNLYRAVVLGVAI